MHKQIKKMDAERLTQFYNYYLEMAMNSSHKFITAFEEREDKCPEEKLALLLVAYDLINSPDFPPLRVTDISNPGSWSQTARILIVYLSEERGNKSLKGLGYWLLYNIGQITMDIFQLDVVDFLLYLLSPTYREKRSEVEESIVSHINASGEIVGENFADIEGAVVGYVIENLKTGVTKAASKMKIKNPDVFANHLINGILIGLLVVGFAKTAKDGFDYLRKGLPEYGAEFVGPMSFDPENSIEKQNIGIIDEIGGRIRWTEEHGKNRFIVNQNLNETSIRKLLDAPLDEVFIRYKKRVPWQILDTLKKRGVKTIWIEVEEFDIVSFLKNTSEWHYRKELFFNEKTQKFLFKLSKFNS